MEKTIYAKKDALKDCEFQVNICKYTSTKLHKDEEPTIYYFWKADPIGKTGLANSDNVLFRTDLMSFNSKDDAIQDWKEFANRNGFNKYKIEVE